MKLTDKPINIQFGGGCPICKGNDTLTVGGSVFKRSVECTACGSKFVSHFGLTSPKWELIDGSSEYLGKVLQQSDWKKLRKGEIDKTDVENRDKQIRESHKTEKILSYLTNAVTEGLEDRKSNKEAAKTEAKPKVEKVDVKKDDVEKTETVATKEEKK